MFLQATNRLTEAEPLMHRALMIFLSSLGAEHPNSVTVKDNYLHLLNKMGLEASEIQRRVAEALSGAGLAGNA